MKINSTTPSFGCGACAAAYRNAEKLAEIPGTFQNIIKTNGLDLRTETRELIKIGMKTSNMTEGQSASSFNKFLKDLLKLYQDQNRVNEFYKSTGRLRK